MRHIVVLTGLMGLAGCQTLDASYGLAFGANTGHLTHRFTNVEVGKSVSLSGHTNAIYFDEVFRNATSLEVHLTRSELCYATGECSPNDYDIRVPANGSTTLESSVETSEPSTESYTETYFGTDASGAAVALTVIFRAAAYQRRASPPPAAAPPASTPGAESGRAQPLPG